MADTLSAPAYAADGTETGEVTLDPEIFGVEPNATVMHQVVTAQLAGARSGSANTKSRSEVRGGGRKPWRQKGLGRARHGSRRSPIWQGGGVAHGPKPRSYAQRTPKKMKRLALTSALSARASEGRIKVIEVPEWAEPSTKLGKQLLTDIGTEDKVLVVLGSADRTLALSLRNLPAVALAEPGEITTYDVLWADTVVFTTDTIEAAATGSYDVAKGDFVREEGS